MNREGERVYCVNDEEYGEILLQRESVSGGGGVFLCFCFKILQDPSWVLRGRDAREFFL